MVTFLIILILNIFLYIFNEKIAQVLNLYDNPDTSRKLHKTKVPLTGGIIILFNVILIIFCQLFYKSFSGELSIYKSRFELIIFFFSVLIFFLIGFIDDKYNVSANKRFLFIAIILLIIILFSENLVINKIEFSFSKSNFSLPYEISIFWTILCFLLFINAFNMFDGINYQAGFYSIYLSLFFLINNFFIVFFLFLIIGLVNFILLNHNNKSFLGDSGSYLLAFIFGYFFIKFYNQTGNIKTDQIVLFMIIPGIDLIRLFITRIIKGNNPFTADRNHLHHIISKNYTLINTNLIIQSLIILPSFLGYYFGFSFIFLGVQMAIYFYFVLFKR